MQSIMVLDIKSELELVRFVYLNNGYNTDVRERQTCSY